jgi:hypothetical protein
MEPGRWYRRILYTRRGVPVILHRKGGYLHTREAEFFNRSHTEPGPQGRYRSGGEKEAVQQKNASILWRFLPQIRSDFATRSDIARSIARVIERHHHNEALTWVSLTPQQAAGSKQAAAGQGGSRGWAWGWAWAGLGGLAPTARRQRDAAQHKDSSSVVAVRYTC